MILAIQDVYYNVADMDRAVLFYRDVLKLEVVERSDHWSALELGGTRIGLHWTGGAEVPGVPRDAHGARTGGTLTLRTTSIRSEREHLEAHGVTVLGASDNDWGKVLVFEDPDGNVLKLMEPPRKR